VGAPLGPHILPDPDVVGSHIRVDTGPILEATLVAKGDDALEDPGIATESHQGSAGIAIAAILPELSAGTELCGFHSDLDL